MGPIQLLGMLHERYHEDWAEGHLEMVEAVLAEHARPGGGEMTTCTLTIEIPVPDALVGREKRAFVESRARYMLEQRLDEIAPSEEPGDNG